MTVRCEYCSKTFQRESSVAAHMCRDKKRWLQRDEQHVKLGLKMFNDWYRLAMGASANKDYKTFVKSRYYSAFVRFGMYILEARVLAPERYLDWLIRNAVKLDTWCRDSVYNQYLAEQSKRETPERALERFVIHADAWSSRTGYHWGEYWQQVKPYTLVNDIKMGRVSPWVFLGYSQAKERLDSLPIDLLTDIADTIDMPFWKRKIELNQPTVQWIEEMLQG